MEHHQRTSGKEAQKYSNIRIFEYLEYSNFQKKFRKTFHKRFWENIIKSKKLNHH